MTALGERVEDTRTLKPGDRIRVEITATVTASTDRYLGIDWPTDAEANQLGALATGHDDISLTAYRLPKPLPPEPGVDSLVVDRHDWLWQRNPVGFWICRNAAVDNRSWAELAGDRGPVRLVGDPIEAP